MEFDNRFTVPLPPDETWALLRDIERIAPCMPGATLTEVVDADTYKGEVSVRLGPVSLTFDGQAEFEAVDDAARTARVKADGKDAKGRGGANATVDFRVEPGEAGSDVLIQTNLMLSGSIAQYGRGVGMVQGLAEQLIGQFAEALRADLAAGDATMESTPKDSGREPIGIATKPISGTSMLFKAALRFLLGLFGKAN